MISRKYFHTRGAPSFFVSSTSANAHQSSLHSMNSIPNYYQSNSHLTIRTDDGDLSVEVVRVFTPFTFSQVLLVRTVHEDPSLRLSAAFLVILTEVYDPHFSLKDRTISGIHLELLWTFEAEAGAARNSQPLPDLMRAGCQSLPMTMTRTMLSGRSTCMRLGI